MKRTTRNNRFVITGGPGAGKTTVLGELEARGFHSVPEVARQLIQEEVRDGGTALPWADRMLYARRMLERSIQSYQEHTPGLIPTFFDRGIPDTLGYARLIDVRDDTFIRNACNQYRYESIVFLAPAWKEIYETDGERKQNFAEAERTCVLLEEIYRECGYEVLEIPRASAQERAEFIVKHVQKETAPRVRRPSIRSRANA